MGNIIRVDFGKDRDGERARAQWADGLSAVGELFGDDEALMRAKAERVHQLLRRIVEEIPTVRVTSHLPRDLTPGQVEMLTGALRAAVHKGIEVGIAHSVRVITDAVYDLCTSKLRQRPS